MQEGAHRENTAPIGLDRPLYHRKEERDINERLHRSLERL